MVYHIKFGPSIFPKRTYYWFRASSQFVRMWFDIIWYVFLYEWRYTIDPKELPWTATFGPRHIIGKSAWCVWCLMGVWCNDPKRVCAWSIHQCCRLVPNSGASGNQLQAHHGAPPGFESVLFSWSGRSCMIWLEKIPSHFWWEIHHSSANSLGNIWKPMGFHIHVAKSPRLCRKPNLIVANFRSGNQGWAESLLLLNGLRLTVFSD